MKSNTDPKVPYQMERVRALINKLQEQLDQQADTHSLLVTVQLLQAELQGASKPEASRSGSGKVAVVMPANSRRQAESTVPSYSQPQKTEEAVPMETSQAHPVPEPLPVQAPAQTDWLHNLMQEIPTLAHQKEIRELNEVMSQQNGASLNDRLRQQSVEVAEVLTREPVRDLKKAIGVNDRFVFVNELFRGDEVMYERSIKTINSFNILQEAEFWIQRELKLKLGWDDSKEVVRHFCQLVRRRFSSK
ncbi:hypothetical protein OI18_05005 [Flavihumibacter solisilvae]|uniref:Uncharacterized protein n=2 Tax=Flavihumibacter solisilvae TaxID=1349421 RepID=A0A0C1IYS3_9BACT|nr:hypothetical protein OI18_05005 [Flavihumibacter solisilvae]